MKILIITDIHYQLDDNEKQLIKSNLYDVLFTLGDIGFSDLLWIKEVCNKPIYGLLGNHDGMSLLETVGISTLHQSSVEINGISFAGIQGSHRYKKSPELCMYTQEESIKIAKNTPAADVLLCHDGPYGLYEKKNAAHCGLKGIREYLKIYNPMMCIHGHLHKSTQQYLNDIFIQCCFRVELIDLDMFVKK